MWRDLYGLGVGKEKRIICEGNETKQNIIKRKVI